MRKATIILASVLSILVGCSQQNPIGSNNTVPGTDTYLALAAGIIPDSIQSATLYLYCSSPSMQTVSLHRVTSSWSDSAVTWANFGGAFDAAAEGSLVANAPGWRTADITPLVRGWIRGQYVNHGLLLDQAASAPRGLFFSRDNVFMKPYLVVCYAGPNGDTCEQFPVMHDASIDQSIPDGNYGFAEVLFTGYAAVGSEYQGLVYIDLPLYTPPPSDTTSTDPGSDTTIVIDPNDSTGNGDPGDSTVIEEPVDHGCTRSASWWLRHSGCAPRAKIDSITPLLPIWLGTPGGPQSVEINSNCEAKEYLLRCHRARLFAAMKPLFSELLAAKLNIAAGADDSAVAEVIVAADQFIGSRAITKRAALTRSEMRLVHQWQHILHRFNVGEIGPGSCGLNRSNLELSEG